MFRETLVLALNLIPTKAPLIKCGVVKLTEGSGSFYRHAREEPAPVKMGAGIQLFQQNISGFPPEPAPAQAGAGMTSLK
jgi:hypothetical protein